MVNSEINLSRVEYRLLSKLYKHRRNQLVFKRHPPGLSRLSELNFASYRRVDASGKISFSGTMVAVHIEPPGENYWLGQHAKRKDRAIEWVRYVVTTTIAIAALIIATISLLAQLGLLQLQSP